MRRERTVVWNPSARAALGWLVPAAIFMAPAAQACTRVLHAYEGLVITGRTMDWDTSMRTSLWTFPRGRARDGTAGPSSVEWIS